MPRPPLWRKAVMMRKPRLAEAGRAFRSRRRSCGAERASVATTAGLRVSADLGPLGSPAVERLRACGPRLPPPACRCSLPWAGCSLVSRRGCVPGGHLCGVGRPRSAVAKSVE